LHAGTKQSFGPLLIVRRTSKRLTPHRRLSIMACTRGTEQPPLVLCTLCTSRLITRIYTPQTKTSHCQIARLERMGGVFTAGAQAVVWSALHTSDICQPHMTDLPCGTPEFGTLPRSASRSPTASIGPSSLTVHTTGIFFNSIGLWSLKSVIPVQL
jgi:hypothetical protein